MNKLRLTLRALAGFLCINASSLSASIALIVATSCICACAAEARTDANPLPHLVSRDGRHALIVDGAPFLSQVVSISSASGTATKPTGVSTSAPRPSPSELPLAPIDGFSNYVWMKPVTNG